MQWNRFTWIIIFGWIRVLTLHAEPILVNDATGAQVQITSASRVIAIGGDVAEFVCLLGEVDRLVARDDTCEYPPEITQLPSVGYMRTLTPEGILSLHPTVILATQGAGPPTTFDRLHAARVPLVQVSQDPNPEAVIQKIQIIAQVLDQAAVGEQWIQRIRTWQGVLEKSLQSREDRPKVLCLMSIQHGSLLGAGQHTGADSMIRLAGGENALGQFTGYKLISTETILAANPDAILLPSHGIEMMGKEKIQRSLPELQNISAVKEGRIVVMNSQYLLMFGPRYVKAAAELAAAIHTGYQIPQELE